MALDFEEMRRVYRLEKSTARLVDVPDDFFSQLHGLIEEERAKYFDSLKDLNATRARDFGNLKKLIDEWFLVREKKLLNTVLMSARLDEPDTAHMAAEEKKMYSSILETLVAHRGITKKVLDANGEFSPLSTSALPHAPAHASLTDLQPKKVAGGRMPISQTSEEPAQPGMDIPAEHHDVPAPHHPYSPVSTGQESASVRILSEIPSFVGTDMKEYGPYKTGQVVELPGKIAQLFISRKLGESSE